VTANSTVTAPRAPVLFSPADAVAAVVLPVVERHAPAAAEALLGAAAGELAEVTRFPVDAKKAARGSIAVAEAKAFASDAAVGVASDLFALAGGSAADERYDLSRHWRNARTHASHDPVDWKYHRVGNYLLNDALPPNHGQL
jgi:alkylation response protein AidB-like acyl-CoA dehydrogenase